MFPISDDPLAEVLNSPVRQTPATLPENYQPGRVIEETCRVCRGSGRFIRGRFVGQCFKCKGTGKVTYKNDAETRAQSRANAATRSARKAEENWANFVQAQPEIAQWILASPQFEFAQKMKEVVQKYGSLTDGQEIACLKMVARRDERRADAINREANAQTIVMDKIEAAFARASARLQKPMLRVGSIRITKAPASGKNAGSLYVKSNDEARTYLGKITAGKFIRSRDCSTEQEQTVLETAADPQAAAIKYGRLTGHCAICDRLLTAEDSLGRGIGPICAERFGWAGDL